MAETKDNKKIDNVCNCITLSHTMKVTRPNIVPVRLSNQELKLAEQLKKLKGDESLSQVLRRALREMANGTLETSKAS